MAGPASADQVGPIDFESYALGPVWGQQGWTGGACGPFDIEVADNSAFAGDPGSFASKSYRISNQFTSGCFADSFTPSLADEAGESTAANGGLSGGTRQPLSVAEWTFASATGGIQPGLNIQVSPDRGDGARMSFVRMRHTASDLELEFFDVQGAVGTPPCFQCANFVSTALGTYDPTVPHTIRLEMRLLDGPSNDVVRVFVDGGLVHTGTSWEDYYTLDTESSPLPPRFSRTVDSLLIRASGAATPTVAGQGFLIDAISLSSGPLTPFVPTALDADPVLLRLNPLRLSVLVGLSAHLTAAGAPLAGKPVAFTVGASPICTGLTNAAGTANCATLLSVGQVRALLALGYQASFGGDGTYLPSSDAAGLLG